MTDSGPRDGILMTAQTVAAMVLSFACVVLLSTSLLVSCSTESKPSDDPAIKALVEQWQDQFPDVSTPAAVSLDNAWRAELQGQGGVAFEWTAKALALDPDFAQAWLYLVGLSSRSTAAMSLTQADSAEVLAALQRVNPEMEGLPAAQAWHALGQGDASAAVVFLSGVESDTEAAWAALRVAKESGETGLMHARRLHTLEPSHREACDALARAAFAAGRLDESERVIMACLQAGASSSVLWRTRGDIADVEGRYDDALAAYQQGDAGLHALAVAVQEDLELSEDDLERALDIAAPVVALHQIWLGVLRDESQHVEDGAETIRKSNIQAPEFLLAMGTADLYRQQPDVALERVSGLNSPKATAIEVQALVALHRSDEATALLRSAVHAQPWNLHLHKLNLLVSPNAESVSFLENQDVLSVEIGRAGRDRESPWSGIVADNWGAVAVSVDHSAFLGVLGDEPYADPLSWDALTPRQLVWQAMWALRHSQDELGAMQTLSPLVAQGLGGDEAPAVLASLELHLAERSANGESVDMERIGALIGVSERALPNSPGVSWVRALWMERQGEYAQAESLLSQTLQAHSWATGLFRERRRVRNLIGQHTPSDVNETPVTPK